MSNSNKDFETDYTSLKGEFTVNLSTIRIFKFIFIWVDVSGWGHKENNFVHKVWHKCEVCGHLLYTLQ